MGKNEGPGSYDPLSDPYQMHNEGAVNELAAKIATNAGEGEKEARKVAPVSEATTNKSRATKPKISAQVVAEVAQASKSTREDAITDRLQTGIREGGHFGSSTDSQIRLSMEDLVGDDD